MAFQVLEGSIYGGEVTLQMDIGIFIDNDRMTAKIDVHYFFHCLGFSIVKDTDWTRWDQAS